MYRYKIQLDSTSIDDELLSKSAIQVSPVYVELNSQGFADLLSCSLETLIDLKWSKDKIEQIRESVWEEIKKVTNPYEFIYAAPNCSIADIKPLSRSFFKMIEMINEFANPIFEQNDAFVSLHIAEGPGGFIEAARYIRKLKSSKNEKTEKEKAKAMATETTITIKNDLAFGITLLNTSTHVPSNVPAWKQSNYFLRNHPEVIISTGADGTGNIYKPENIKKLYMEIEEKCLLLNNDSRLKIVISSGLQSSDSIELAKTSISNTLKNDINEYVSDLDNTIKRNLKNIKNIFANLDVEVIANTDSQNTSSASETAINISTERSSISKSISGYAMFITADGGFDYSIDYNYQEQASSKLIFSQILTALKCQGLGGMFICKVFDINLYITVEMIYLLYIFYDSVTIYKPVTSRIANSEKYLICSGFKGIDNVLLETLFKTLAKWNDANEHNETINQLFVEIPIRFIEELKMLNSIIVKKQIEVINGIIHVYHNKLNLDSQWKRENYKKQHDNAIGWCIKYNIPYKKYKKS
jgi:23S rRNA U2552 (ribose-2'-O)-methylase RlmE/FtsJ